MSLAPAPAPSMPPPPPPYYGAPPPPYGAAPPPYYGAPYVHVSPFQGQGPVAHPHSKLMYAYVLGPILVMMIGGIVSAASARSSGYDPPPAPTVARPTAVTAAATPQAEPPRPKPVLRASAGAYTPKQSALIRFDGMPTDSRGWVSIAKAGTSPQTYLTYQYASSASGEVSFPLSSYPPGAYVARAYPDGGYTVVAEIPFTIRSARASR